ncbi:flagella synthesis protein FlgN [Noviherbaspirillum soli]|uniref:flagella synthesis protein FlgN n=1 Tax=Noviherbaspirillum soli TaxID=1064518 RepID=UPI00188B57B1|nr:flagellar protein FlgN [Noviherbaspirillum soli]
MHPAQHSPAAGLSRERELARQLQECLQQEQAELVRADVAALVQTAGRKSGIVDQMNLLAQARMQALAAAGHAATEAGMLAWLAAQDDAVRADWQALLAAAAAGKELNRTNGLLIHQHISRNQAGLQALRGGGQPAVYGRDGQQNVRTAGRSFVAG